MKTRLSGDDWNSQNLTQKALQTDMLNEPNSGIALKDEAKKG